MEKKLKLEFLAVLQLHHRKARTGRNPKTGQYVALSEKFSSHFKTGKELRDRVNSSHNEV